MGVGQARINIIATPFLNFSTQTNPPPYIIKIISTNDFNYAKAFILSRKLHSK
jgi:hypothetical protein